MTPFVPRLSAMIASLFSFRVVMAFATSVAVTSAVSGPLAFKAAQIRTELASASEAPGVSEPAPGDPEVASPPVTDPVTGEIVETTTTSSSTTTSSTTTPAVTVPGATTTPGAGPTPTPAPTAPAPTAPAPTAPTTTRPPTLTANGLTVALDANLTQTFPLDGFRLFGRLYIYAAIDGATSVSYWIDSTGPNGPADRTVSTAPFMLGTPLFDTATLGNGTHSVYVRATTPLGNVARYAVFEVVNG